MLFRSLTPDLSRCGVAGVMRRHIIEQAAKAGIQVQVAAVPLGELQQAREIFLCNSLLGVWPVAALAGKNYPVGPMARQALQWAAAC